MLKPFRLDHLLRRWSDRLIWLAAAMLCAGAIHAQPPVANPALPDRIPSALEKGVVKPDAFYLRDSGGNYIFVPNLRYEEFERLLRSQKPLLDPQLPSYQILSWKVDGDARRSSATWRVTISVRLSSAATAAVAIPIGMPEWHLAAAPQFQGEGEHLLELISPSTGFQWWIKGAPDTEHTVQLELISKVNQLADRELVKVSTPSAPLKVRLVADGVNLRPEIEGQAGIAIAVQEIDGKRTEFTYDTSGGNHNLQWRRGNDQSRAILVECQSATRVNVEEVGKPWKCSTKFTLQANSTTAYSEFTIVLPAGSQWQPSANGSTEPKAYQIEALPSETGAAATDRDGKAMESLLTCRLLDDRLDVPLEVDLDWSWIPQTITDGGQIRFVGPQIRNMDRHEGFIEFNYPSSYRFTTLANSNTFPIPNSATNNIESNSVRYRFDRQPASLNVSLRPEFSETRLRPTYMVEVYRNRAILKGILDISIPQGLGSNILLAPSNWAISEVEQVSSGATVSIQDEGENRLRLQPPQATSTASENTRSLSWRLEGVRELADEPNLALELDLPSLINELAGVEGVRLDYGVGTLVLVPADNVMLQPSEVETVGLIADSEIPQAVMDLIPPERRRRAVAYRFQTSSAVPKWYGRRELLPQQVTAEADTHIDVGSQLVSLTQRWKLRIANEPLSRLQMIVQREAFERSSVIATLDGNSISLSEAVVDPTRSIEMTKDEILVESTQLGDLIGELQIAVDTKFPISVAEGSEVENQIGLATLLLPEKTGFLKSSLSVKHSSDIELLSTATRSRTQPDWQRLDLSTSSDIPFLVDSGLCEFKAEVKRLDRQGVGSVRLVRSWLQTAFNTAQRRDRMVFLVETKDRRIQVQIPAENLADLYDVLIDGNRALYSVDKESSTLILDVPEDLDKATRCIELWSEAARAVTGEGVSLSIPRILNSSGNVPFLWELVLPASEHLVLPPVNLTPEWQWTWLGFGWQRRSATNQTELEVWSGASSQTPLPARLNRYIMSGFGLPAEISFTSLPKPWIWLPVGAMVIVLTLVWSTINIVRHPVALATFFVSLVTVAIYLPDAAVVIGQLIVVAALLAITMLIAQWAIGRRVKRRSVFTSYPTPGSQSLATGSGISRRQDRNNTLPIEIMSNAPSGTATVTNPGVAES